MIKEVPFLFKSAELVSSGAWSLNSLIGAWDTKIIKLMDEDSRYTNNSNFPFPFFFFHEKQNSCRYLLYSKIYIQGPEEHQMENKYGEKNAQRFLRVQKGPFVQS